jgi:hypothetical protein
MFDVFRKPLTVRRVPQGSYIDGAWVEIGSEIVFTITASVQGVDAEILQTLPEGYRTKEAHILYTSSELKTSQLNLRKPDVVEIDGDKFQVIKVTKKDNIKNYPTNHYEVIVIKENVDDN